MNVMSIDVEEWFHILNSPVTPSVETWHRLEPRLRRNVEELLALLDETNTHATFFWLGWAAERYRGLVKRCRDAGHEIGSHGYSHLACSTVGRQRFHTDIVHARQVLEDILGESVTCFRAPGFAINGCTDWCFDTIRAAGYTCDSSALAVRMVYVRGCVGYTGTYAVETETGPLVEVPVSSFNLAGGLVWTFGGGYFRIAPWMVLRRASKQVHKSDKPIVIYIHPRDIDPESPCLPLGPWQRFKFAVNRQTTITKLRSLLTTYEFRSVRECVASAGLVPCAKPVDIPQGMESTVPT